MSHSKKTFVVNKQLNFYPTNGNEDLPPRGKCTIGPDSYYLMNNNNTTKGLGHGRRNMLEFIQNKSKNRFNQTNQIEFCARPDKGDIGSDFTKESHAMMGLGKSDYAYGETKHLSLSPSKIVRKKYLAKR